VENYLVVAATAAEARYVPDGMPVVITGIGKTAAAVATSRALAAYDDSEGLTVLNLGTAGALREGITGIHEPRRVINHDINAEAIRALGYDPQERLDLGTGDDIVLATGDVFVTDQKVRDRLAEQASLVDMEGYAVAYAAQQFGVPVRLIKHVSDNADVFAMDWPTVVDASARQLGQWLRQL